MARIEHLPREVRKVLTLKRVRPLAIGLWEVKGSIKGRRFTAQIAESGRKLYINGIDAVGPVQTILSRILEKFPREMRKVLGDYVMASKIASRLIKEY